MVAKEIMPAEMYNRQTSRDRFWVIVFQRFHRIIPLLSLSVVPSRESVTNVFRPASRRGVKQIPAPRARHGL